MEVWSALADLYGQSEGPLTVVHGKCPNGADLHAALWCIAARDAQANVIEEPHPAAWDQHGKRAGFLRNSKMVDLGADVCLAFIREESKGASMTADLAEQAGIETVRFIR